MTTESDVADNKRLVETHLAGLRDIELVEILTEDEDTIILGMSDGNIHMYSSDLQEWYIVTMG